jgi:flagellar biosynthesis chaperone FliJ
VLTEKIINSLKRYPTKYKQGLTEIELNDFLKEHKLNEKQFLQQLGTITIMIKEDTVIMYKHDIEICLIQFLNNNNSLSSYFD